MLPLLMLLAVIALPDKPAQYVTDRAGVFDKQRADALNAKLAKFDRDTSTQILVYTDRKLPPETSMEEMGAEAMLKWGVGQKGKDNGAILFVFTEERKMRIEVGYGLEPTLTDAKSKRITSTILKPEFRKGDFAGGIEKGVDAIFATVRGEDFGGAKKRSISAWVVLMPIGLVMLLVGIILWLVNRESPAGRAAMTPSPSPDDSLNTAWMADSVSSSSTSWSDSDSSSSSSSSSDDSFSGGGGSGGGGGASDSW
jgi:uncharacterized protein